jgi:hydrogenase expression/formation protein HypC
MCLGIPGQVVSITNPAQQLGRVKISGVQREVNLTCIVTESHPLEHCVGDWVLVHVGFALSRIDEQEANQTLQMLAELSNLQAELTAQP